MNKQRPGIARIDALVAIVCAIAMISLALSALGQQGAVATHELTQKDATQLRDIHKCFLVFSREFQDIFPKPGAVNRLPHEGQQVPGRGEEDIARNTTASLYSVLVVMNYFTPDLIISPVERNPNVKVAANYNYDAYNPAKDVYWDPAFVADLRTGSNASYAHLPIFGKRSDAQWRGNFNARHVVLGNRGPKDGAIDPSSYTCSPHGLWSGNLCFNDNHTEFSTSVTPENAKYHEDGAWKPDNVFLMEQGVDGGDSIIAFTQKMTKEGPTLQFD